LESRVDGYRDARCHCIESLVQGPKLALVNDCGSERAPARRAHKSSTRVAHHHLRCAAIGSATMARVSNYLISNLISSCAHPEVGGRFGDVSGR